MKNKKFLFLSSIVIFSISCSDVDEQESGNNHAGDSDIVEILDPEEAPAPDENSDNDEINDCVVSLNAFVWDEDEGATNVRNSPSGDVILSLEANGDFELNIIGSMDGWFKVHDIYSINADGSIDIPGSYGWIHGSVIGIGTRNYGGQPLNVYVDADASSSVVVIIEEESIVRPKDVCGDWVQIEYTNNGKTNIGWIEKEWLCGSAVTNCS